MDNGTLQLLGAAGGLLGLLMTLVMTILAILVPFFIWRIWKWTSVTAEELKKLNDKFDQLLLQQQDLPAPAPAPISSDVAPVFTDTPEQEQGLAAEQDELATETAALRSEETAEDTPAEGFVAEPREEEPHPDTDVTAPAEDDLFSSDESDFPAGDDFDFGEEDFDTEAQAETEAGFPAEKTAEDDFGAAFDEDFSAPGVDFAATDTKGDDEAVGFDGGNAQEAADAFGADEQPATGEDVEEPEEEPAEQRPDIIPLDPDPRRPEVRMARCGSCDHKLAYKQSLSGKKARCPSCKAAFVLP